GVGQPGWPAFLAGCSNKPRRAIPPHPDRDRFAGEYHPGETGAVSRDTTDVAVEDLVDHRFADDPVAAQAVQDGPIEAAFAGEFGIGVDRVHVAGEAIQQRLLRQSLAFDL